MGEAGPEAIIPLKRGRDGKLGVAGGGGTRGQRSQGDSEQCFFYFLWVGGRPSPQACDNMSH